MRTSKINIFFCCIFCCSLTNIVYAQPTWTLDPFGKEKKPAEYEEKLLASEKTGDKKFTTFRRIIQNNVTHYNYYFNANNKLNDVIERAKLSHKDDYSQLLSFYPYDLENTAAQQTELDSVIYKATAGILLHDLRTDWVDNMYLLIGKSYYFRKELDSAALTFQFINYNLFPRKKKEDDNRIVGTNDAPSTGTLSIANKEKRNVVQRILTLPPSRNDALIWLTRTFIDKEEFGDAAGLINILQQDPNLPKRLKNDLEEVTAYWFFVQNNLDSTAKHLEKSLSNADDHQDKSRRQFLLAQILEINGDFDQASTYYLKAAKGTTNPIMDIFARLNNAKMLRNTGNTKELQSSIDNLLKMARKDKFENYRDIIYYSTGQLSMQIPDTANALISYKKSIKYNNDNSLYRNKSFLELADLSFSQKKYVDAHSYYDSLDLADQLFAEHKVAIAERKESLQKIVEKINIIHHQDSLQLIAAMPAAERDALIKKLVKKYRKENGLKEEQPLGEMISFNTKNAEPVDLFTNNSKGDWYFYNSSARSRGYSEFKAKWGKRENVDNWQRKSAIETAKLTSGTTGVGNFDDPGLVPVNTNSVNNVGIQTVEFSYDALLSELPLTTEKLDSSNLIIADNLLALAKLFQDDLQDYDEAIVTYLDFLKRFPNNSNLSEVYLGLYFCYNKIGDPSQANYYKNVVTTQYTGTAAGQRILNPSLLNPNQKNPEGTQRYAAIYNSFIEGDFEAAIRAKNVADSIYGTTYWTPQLLYIEAIYNIKQKNDSSATSVLNNLIQLYPNSALHEKAAVLLDVLSRRSAIEKYLNNLEIVRAPEEKTIFIDDKPVVSAPAPVKPVEVKPVVVKPTVKLDIMKDSIIKTPSEYLSGSFKLNPEKPHYVVMLLDKVDGVYINEAKNAFARLNRESMATLKVVITRDAIDGEKTLLLFSPFEDADAAIKYFDLVKKRAPSEVSWLQPSKYSFFIISDDNLQILKTNKDLESYRKLLNTNFGNKF